MQFAGRLAAAGMIVFAFVSQMMGGLNPDASWLLTVGERMLAGQQLYVDIYELNPPMSALLYLPAVALAKLLTLPAEPIVVAGILILALVSLRVTTAMLTRAGLVENRGQFWLIALATLVILPGGNFGEREHIAVILLLPLLGVSAVRSLNLAPKPAEVVISGIAAGLVMTIKPHFAVVIFLVAAVSAFQARSWRAVFTSEHVLAGAILIGYWLVVWIGFPSFFSAMLPLASPAYLADRADLLALVIGLPVVPAWLMLAGLLLVYRPEMAMRPNAQLLAAALGFFVVYLVQGKGFFYHALPVVMLMSLVFVQSFLTRNARGRYAAIPVALAVILVVAPGALAFRGSSDRQELMAILAPLGPGLKIANITSQLEIASPLHRDIGGTLVNSGPCLWISLGAIRRQMSTDDPLVDAEMVALENYERGVLSKDLLRNPPDIILSGADTFDWIAWASQDADIAALLANYEMLATIGPPERALQVLGRKAG